MYISRMALHFTTAEWQKYITTRTNYELVALAFDTERNVQDYFKSGTDEDFRIAKEQREAVRTAILNRMNGGVK